MNGHQRIIEMRCNGQKPEVVWINDMAGYRVDPEDNTVTVSVHDDTPEACDFRFLEGVRVVVFESTSDQRTERFTKALLQHAKRVVATTWQSEDGASIAHISDSEGALSWPS